MLLFTFVNNTTNNKTKLDRCDSVTDTFFQFSQIMKLAKTDFPIYFRRTMERNKGSRVKVFSGYIKSLDQSYLLMKGI